VIVPPADTSAGFRLLGHRYVVIDGFTIEDTNGVGIQVRSSATGVNSAYVTIRNVGVHGSTGRGIDVSAEGEVRIENSVVAGNGSSGISVSACDAPLALCGSQPAQSTVVVLGGNRAENNGVHGFFVSGGALVMILESDLRQNGESGIQVRLATDVIIEGNLLKSNHGDGIRFGTANTAPVTADVKIIDNEVADNGKSGVAVVAAGPVMIEGNVVAGSSYVGISVTGGSSRSGDLQDQEALARVSRNTVRNSGNDGIFIAYARDGALVDNRSCTNQGTGLTLRAASGFLIGNNLIYANGEHGIGVGTGDSWALNTAVANNTAYSNGGWGLAVGSSGDDSRGATVVDNIFAGNLQGGITVARQDTAGYVAGFNVNPDGYGPDTPANAYDLNAAPGFVDPAGLDHVLGGDGFADDDFRLREGPEGRSAAIDAGSTTAERRGMTGSALASGAADIGVLDIGYHYDTTREQRLDVQMPFMPLYVRVSGRNGRSGKSPRRAFASVAAAAARARAGVTVVVGPGRYEEGDVHPVQNGGRVTFLADPGGALTGDPAGPVLLDAGGADTAFVLRNAAFAVVDGFHVRGAAIAGLQVRMGSDHAQVRNNVVFSNLSRGIDVQDAGDVAVLNNLVYANGGGIQLSGAPRAVVQSNTCYGSAFNGITVGAGVPAPCALLLYNVVQGSGKNGIQVGSNSLFSESLVGYTSGYNMNADGYGAGTPRPDSDLLLSPGFVQPAGADGVLGGDGFRDDSFCLEQVAAGQLADSPGLDFAPIEVTGSGLEERSTRSDRVPDSGRLDLGFHYATESTDLEWVNPARPESPADRMLPDFCYALEPGGCTAGDCSGDGEVTVDEIIMGVRIALGEAAVEDCLQADGDGDGEVTVDELLAMVGAALGGEC